MKPARSSTSTGPRGALPAVGLMVLSAGLWWGWFAWDTRADIDPVTGSSSGPYGLWQVIGCAATWIALGWIGSKVLHPLLVVLLMPAGFTAAFALTGASSDDSGLWAVGALFVAFGTLVGTAVLVMLLNWRTPLSANQASKATG